MNIIFKKTLLFLTISLIFINLSAEAKIVTALKSAIIPGWGELSKGNNTGYFFLASEIALWSGKYYLLNESDLKLKQAKQFAINKANLSHHSYPEEILFLMEKFDRSGFETGGYNESIVRNAMEMFPGNPQEQTNYIMENRLPADYQWDWESRSNRRTYQIMRKDSAHFDDYAKAVSGVIIVNHIASFFNALRVANKETNFHISSSFDRNLTPYLNCNFRF